MALELTLGQMVVNIKANGRMTKDMVLGSTSLEMVMSKRGFGKMTNEQNGSTEKRMTLIIVWNLSIFE